MATAPAQTPWQRRITAANAWEQVRAFGDADGQGKLGHPVRDITVNTNGDIAIIDGTAQVKIFNRAGEFQRSFEASQPPWQITSWGGDYFMTFGQTNNVQRYNDIGELNDQWSLRLTRDQQNQRLEGLAIDDADGSLYVGVSRSNVARKYKSSGDWVGDIQTDNACVYLAFTGTRIVASPNLTAVTNEDETPLGDPAMAIRGLYYFQDTLLKIKGVSGASNYKIACYSTSTEIPRFLDNIQIPDVRLDERPIQPQCVTMTNDGTRLLVGVTVSNPECGSCIIYDLKEQQ